MLGILNKSILYLAATFMFLLMVLTFADVVGRNLLSQPIIGASELTELFLAGMVFLLLPASALREEHIAVDLIDNLASPKLDLAMQYLRAVLGGALFGWIGWRLWGLGDRSIDYGDATASLGVPLGPVIYAMSILSVLHALALLLRPFVRSSHRTANGVGSDSADRKT